MKSYGNNNPVFLKHFEAAVKPFYMKTAEDQTYTESCDLLLPNVGEIVGGSMRKEDYDQLMKGFKDDGIDPKPYYWYTDMARFGPRTQGGFGLGFERLLVGLMRWKSVVKGCLYPRFINRCYP